MLSLEEISAMFGGKEQTTTIKSVRAFFDEHKIEQPAGESSYRDGIINYIFS